jgi:hypothetical protein
VNRSEHSFHFQADKIAEAAEKEAAHHREREKYWKDEYEKSVARVEETVSAKVARQKVTGGERATVVVDYGDPEAFARMGQAFDKAQRHRADAERYESDAAVYGSQGGTIYELSVEDVHYFRLGGRPEDE